MSPSRRPTVLVVDDDADIQQLIAILLGEAGYQTVAAHNGRQALARLEEEMPDLILLDMKMPEMDGWEFAAHFRRRYGDAVPIVVLTASQDARRRAMEVWSDAFLGKPFSIDELVSIVEEYVHLGV